MRPTTLTTVSLIVATAIMSLSSCKKQEMNEMTSPTSMFESAKGNNKSVSFYALTDDNQIAKYSGIQTFRENSRVAISGLQASERILSIDFRPATGQLYGVSNQSRIYVIHQMNGMARAVSATPFTPAISGTEVGFDFNPTVDRIRLVTNTGQDLRLNPETGLVVAIDGNLNPGNPNVVAVAYTNSIAGAASTTLYDIDVNTDKLYIQNPPNNGTLAEVGRLEVDAMGEGGFDISPDNSWALAALNARGDEDESRDGYQNRFYTINLQTGKATNAGLARMNIIGVAIATNPVAYSVAGGNQLLIFNPMDAGTQVSKPITGLQAGETILGIDMRPVNGQLFALGSSSRIYTLNASSGAAAVVGSGFTPALSGTQFAFDFNPTVDRIRIISNTGQNLRAHPMTGVVAFVDGNINPGMPMVDAGAYTNNFAGATTTTLYDIDYGTSMLYMQVPPNNGTLVPVGSLGISIAAGNGFDIGGTTGNAWAILKTGSMSGLYSINLTTGTASKISDFNNMANGFAVGLGF
jgi:hypothetical protein